MVKQTAMTKDGDKAVLEMEEMAEIGRGAFGKVLKMRIKEKSRPTQLVAVKNPTENEYQLDQIEKKILSKLSHKNVVKLLYYYSMNDELVNLVLELVDGGDLFEFIQQNYRPKTGIGIYADLFTFQLFRGLAYIHSKNVAHRDIKPENLLVNKNLGILKICDFGLATVMSDEKTNHTSYVGTRLFRPPELLLGANKYTTKVDCWGGGIVLTQVLLSRPIFFRHTPRELMLNVFEYTGLPTIEDFREMHAEKISLPRTLKRKRFRDAFVNIAVSDLDQLEDLLNHIFVFQASRRYSAWEVCDHQFFDRLKQDVTLPNGNKLPDIFDFTSEEISSMPGNVSKSLGTLQSKTKQTSST